MMIVTEKQCRACGGRLDTLLNLGNLYPSHFRLPGEPLPSRIPLDYCACRACRLVQLRHTVEADALFRPNYWYLSSVNETMVAELSDIVKSAIAMVPAITNQQYVLDIGANDGTLLSCYPRDITRVAIDPADNLHPMLSQHTEIAVHGYFPEALDDYRQLTGRCAIITSIACFYAVDDPHAFIRAIRRLLAPDGVWIVQFQDLQQMQTATAYDNITFEHLCYYSLASIGRLLQGSDLRVIDVERRAINGGSLRVYIRHEANSLQNYQFKHITSALDAEADCEAWQTHELFAWRVGQARDQLHAALSAVSGTIDLYGASTKGNTLQQYCGLGPETIRQAWERSPAKYGRLTATGIPIVSEDDGRNDPPDVMVAGIWQFRESILTREAEYLATGRPLIFPLPEVDVIRQGVQV